MASSTAAEEAAAPPARRRLTTSAKASRAAAEGASVAGSGDAVRVPPGQVAAMVPTAPFPRRATRCWRAERTDQTWRPHAQTTDQRQGWANDRGVASTLPVQPRRTRVVTRDAPVGWGDA